MSATRPPLPKSLWAATAPPAPDCPPLAGDAKAEVAIVGGGFTGLSAALHLAEKGVAVTLLEAAEPGFGASGRNGGQVIAGLKEDPGDLVARFGEVAGERLVAFAGGTADFVFDLIARYGLDCDARREGWVQAAHAPLVLPALEKRVQEWQARGAPVELLDQATTARLLGTQGYAGGLLDRRGGRLQPLAYARGLARAAIGLGAAIHGATPVTALEREADGWRLATPGGSVKAKRVLLATNGYTDGLWPGLARSVVPAMSYQAATAPLSDNLRRSILPEGHVVSDTRRLLAYYRLDPAGRLVLGGRGRFKESDDPADYRHIQARLKELFPQLGEPQWQFFWGGKVALTLDHLPHVHELAPGLMAALGYNGRGVAMASRMGAAMADWAAGLPAAELPLPPSAMRPLPLQGLRRPVLAMAVGWKRWRDRQESGWRRDAPKR